MSKSLLICLLSLWTTRECFEVEKQSHPTVREHQFQIHGVEIMDRETVANERVKRQTYFTQPQHQQPQQQQQQQQQHIHQRPQPQQFVNQPIQQQQLIQQQPHYRNLVQQSPPPRPQSSQTFYVPPPTEYATLPKGVVSSDSSPAGQNYLPQPPPRPQSPSFPPRPAAPVPPPTFPAVDPNGAARYYYPPRMRLPLPKCFHNPTGYVCCNEKLNDLIVETYTELEARPKFHTCNVQALATNLQRVAEKHFNTTFETIAGYEDFAQKIHFKGDLVCKVELGGKYMLAYGTVKNVAENRLPAIDGYDQHGPVARPQESHRFRI